MPPSIKSDGSEEKLDNTIFESGINTGITQSGGGSSSTVSSSSVQLGQSSPLSEKIRTGLFTVDTLNDISVYLSSRFKHIGGLRPMLPFGHMPPPFIDITDKSKARVLQFCQGTSFFLLVIFFCSLFCVGQ